MPPTTRRRSRMMSAGELPSEPQPQEDIKLETRRRKKASRKVSKDTSLEQPFEATKNVLQHRQLEDFKPDDETKLLPMSATAVNKHAQSIELTDITGSLSRSDKKEEAELSQPDVEEAFDYSDDDQKLPVSGAQLRLDDKGKESSTLSPAEFSTKEIEQAKPLVELQHSDTPEPEHNDDIEEKPSQQEEQENEHEQTGHIELAAPQSSHSDEVEEEEKYSEDESEKNTRHEQDEDEDEESETAGEFEIEENPQPQRPPAHLPIIGPDPSSRSDLYTSSSTYAPPPPAPPRVVHPRREWTMVYTCDQCESPVTVGGAGTMKDDTVDRLRCRECGCRCLWKRRTTRMVQFEAR